MASSLLRNDKGNAMRTFQRNRNLENMLQFFNLCVALFLFSHSSLFPITLQTLSNLYHTLAPLFHNTFYAFLLLNTIILFLFALSNNNNNVVTSSTAPSEQQQQPRTLVTNNISDSELPESLSSLPVVEKTVTAVTETTTTTLTKTAEGVSEKKYYRRVQSESYERRMVVAAELKRCNTTTKLKKRLKCMELLSEDEFNRAVEDFIAMHKRMQWQEQIGSHKTESLPCTL